MRIGLFEQQMTRIIPSFAGFTEFTSSIPKLYWDVKSQEQRILAICKLLNKVICYADMLGENVDEIAHTLQEILDGKLDTLIIAAIAEWFEENEPQILQDIDAINAKIGEGFDAENTVANAIDGVADDVTATNNKIGEGFDAQNTVANAIDAVANSVTATNNIIGEGFSSENTVADAIDAANSDIENLQEDMQYAYKFIDEVDANSFVYPKRIGIIRTKTNNFSTIADNPNKWAQGFCIHQGEMVQAISTTDITNPNTVFYTRNIADVSWSSPTTANAYKASSIKYINSINRYYVCSGRPNEIVILDNGLDRVNAFTVGTTDTIVLLAYDKKTGLLYGSHYGHDLFVFPADYGDDVTYLPIWDEAIPDEYGSLQDIAAYDGCLYILYSNTGRIEKRRIDDGRYIGCYTFSEKQHNTFIGETEGIDVDEDGKIFFSCNLKENDVESYYYAYIWMIDPDNPAANENLWFPSVGGNTRVVIDASDSNLLGCQDPDGSAARPYPTINEAIIDMMCNPWLSTIALSGNHNDEPIFAIVPQLKIDGNSQNKPTIGYVQIRNGCFMIANTIVDPLIAVSAKILGYRSCVVIVDEASVEFGNSTAATGGHNISVQGLYKGNLTYTEI